MTAQEHPADSRPSGDPCPKSAMCAHSCTSECSVCWGTGGVFARWGQMLKGDTGWRWVGFGLSVLYLGRSWIIPFCAFEQSWKEAWELDAGPARSVWALALIVPQVRLKNCSCLLLLGWMGVLQTPLGPGKVVLLASGNRALAPGTQTLICLDSHF